MWPLFCFLLPLVSGQRFNLTKIWNELKPGVQPYWEKESYQRGPYGVLIREWKLTKCASEQWTDYLVNISNIFISPNSPRFPGPIFFNVTVDVKENLPIDNLELDIEIRHGVTKKDGSKGFLVIPCQEWNINDGCDGIGSCRYCNILDRCNKAMEWVHKYVEEGAASDFLRKEKLCPPPKGHSTMTFSKNFTSEDLPKAFFRPLQSNEYWFTFALKGANGKEFGCARLWLDVCKYLLEDKTQRCLKEPNRYYTNCWGDYSAAEKIRNRG